MDSRSKDSIRNTERLVIELVEQLAKALKTIESLKKDMKGIKRASVRKYKKDGQG